MRDLKGIGANGHSFARLFESIRDFLNIPEKNSESGPSVTSREPPASSDAACVAVTARFEDVLIKMADKNVHRVFVCADAFEYFGNFRLFCLSFHAVVSQI